MRLSPALLLLPAALALTACLRKEEPAAPAPPAVSGPRVIRIIVGDNMKYSVPEIDAAPGEELRVIVTSTASQPRAAMAHNFVLLVADADVETFLQTAATAKADDYLPPALLNQVLAHTKLLGPGDSDEVEFKAPAAPGDYYYLCTFPGHFLTGMRGVLVVK